MDILVIIAQLGPPGAIGIPDQPLAGGTFANTLNVVYFIAGAIAVITMIIGGILIMASSGDPGKSAKGRNAVLYSAIGLVVVALAFGITRLVLTRVGIN